MCYSRNIVELYLYFLTPEKLAGEEICYQNAGKIQLFTFVVGILHVYELFFGILCFMKNTERKRFVSVTSGNWYIVIKQESTYQKKTFFQREHPVFCCCRNSGICDRESKNM